MDVLLKKEGNKRTDSHTKPLNEPKIHMESVMNASGNRMIMVTLPNINIASPNSSNKDKLEQAAIPIMGHGSMTRSDQPIAGLGMETGASVDGKTVDDNGLVKRFTSSFTRLAPYPSR